MKKFLVLGVLAVAVCLVALVAPASAAGTLYVDDDGVCGGNSPCYTHPQDAVNAADPGDTILVYPGVYNERQFTTPVPPHWGAGDQYAPALIVWKDGLTIQAMDPTPGTTVIQTLYDFWVNKDLGGGGGGGSIEHSTGCVWNAVAKTWDGTCVRPTFGTPPNAVAIIASNVTLDGFTIHRPISTPNTGYNAAGVMIGALYSGQGGLSGETLGFDNNTVKNCTFSDVWHAVYIWHSSGNQITDNTVAALGNTGHWAAISAYDGGSDAEIGYGNLSTNNVTARNTLADKGIYVGAWGPTVPTNNSGTQIVGNTVQGDIMLAYSASSGVEIHDNTLPGPTGQIKLDGGPSSFTSCEVSGNTVGAGTTNGLDLRYMTDCEVSGNTVGAGTPNGMYIQYMTRGSVSDNDVSGRTANGIALLDSTGVSITGNASTDNGASGLVLVRTADVLVSGNQILRNAGNTSNPGGLTVREGVGSTTVEDNTISNNTQYGVWIRDTAGAGNVFHCNRIVANGVGMLNNTASLVDAEDNWWGSATGPTHASNPGGTGDSVSDNVDFDPWLTTEFCAAPTPTPTPPPGVGGAIELHGGASTPSAQQSDSAALPYAALALAAAAAAIAIAASAWYARRRWIR